jgi:hypothetical protein
VSTRQLRHALVVGLFLLAACAERAPIRPTQGSTVSPTATPVLSPTSSVPPSFAVATVPPYRATPTPIGAPRPNSLRVSASTEQEGIRITIRVGSNPLHAGNPTGASVTIKNTGRRLLRWSNDGCDTNAGISAVMRATWRDSDLTVSPELAPYRDWLREDARFNGAIRLQFLRGPSIDRRSVGCADLGIGRELRPGRSVTQEFVWDGFAARRQGLPPSGPLTLSVSFDRWTRPGPGAEGAPVEVSLKSWMLDGRPDELLSPAEAIDAALKDKEFSSWLVTRPLRNGASAITEFDRDLGIWAVGLIMFRDPGRPILHAAFIDATTGEVIAIREHPVDL